MSQPSHLSPHDIALQNRVHSDILFVSVRLASDTPMDKDLRIPAVEKDLVKTCGVPNLELKEENQINK